MSRPSVEISGNLLSEAILDSLAEEGSKHPFAKLESFRWYKYDVIDSQSIHLSRIAEAYEKLKARWDMLSSSFSELDISALRDKWIRYLFTQLGYNLEYQKADVVADSGNKFCLSHRGWVGESAPVVHTALFNQDLDRKPDDGRHKYSPHDTLQRYLNQSKTDIWGIVTNGRELRILRDFHHETRQACVKFDLELIFEGRNYTDFRLLWRLMHPSRFIAGEEGKCILENLFEESKNAGVAIGENLQKNIRLAIESLANGFLLSTSELIDKTIDNSEESLHFYQQILQVIYRVLFLFYSEQRKLMPTHSALYAREYSLSSLRQKIELQEFVDPHHTDLWEGLKITFQMVYQGVPELGIPAFNGQLFNPRTIEQLDKSKCRNDKLLEAIQYMSVFEKEGLMHRISYIELNVDEIGSIYESLLEYIPSISSKEEVFEDAVFGTRRNRERRIPPRTFFLDPRGTNRKTSGSYYTHPGLVNALIESALVPVLEEKLKTAGPNKDAQEKALLSTKVCDPACGSAAFLIAATDYLGEELAKIRIQGEYPSDADIRYARREVLRHCIYGVDLNPMAVELAKVSLWLTAATSDLPLNFLDHRIKCGNSLIGTTPELMKKGIPPEAYSAVEGDNKDLAKKRMKLAKDYLKDKGRGQFRFRYAEREEAEKEYLIKDISEVYGENTPGESKEIEKVYRKNREREEFLKNKFIADYWCSAFFWKHDNETENYPNPERLEHLLEDEKLEVAKSLKDKVNQIAKDYKFFHWHLEFPNVFANGGFDCVLGNPPWEKINFRDSEFFASKAPDIAYAPNKNKREELIKKLPKVNPSLYENYLDNKRFHDGQSIFYRFSKKYPFTGVSRINLYSVFSELSSYLLNKGGNAGIIVPSGIVTDDNNKALFNYFLDNGSIISVFDFENKEGLFPTVHRSFKFCLLTVTKNNVLNKITISFFNTNLENYKTHEKQLTLSKEEIVMINPNTKNCPIFRNKKDAEITKQIYKRFPILINEREKQTHGWKVSIKTPFNTANDSHLFNTQNELQNSGYRLRENIFINGDKKYVPLYEGKMIWIYNHRYCSVDYGNGFVPGRHDTVEINDQQLKNPSFCAMPRLWVNEKDVRERYPNKLGYIVCFRGITNSSSERTAIFSIIPNYGLGDSCPMIIIDNEERFLLIANCLSYIFDFIVRQKIGGNNLNFYIVKQLPIIPLGLYSEEMIRFVKNRVLKLVYTSYELTCFAKNLGYVGEPILWDEERRLELMTDMDALYAHLYQITKDELDYILDTFPIVRRKDKEKYGEYRTKKLILKKYSK